MSDDSIPLEPDPLLRDVDGDATQLSLELPAIAGYRMVRELARGGMGVVYEAHSQQLGRSVALKVLYDDDESSPESRRFRVEAMAAARLEHPHIVQCLGTGRSGGCSYIVMELVEGESLRMRLRRDGPMEPRQAVEMFQQLVGALTYAHEEQILHRDLKPDNVLLTRDGKPLISDFGLAKLVGTKDIALTRSGQLIGTLTYVSPEQANGDRARLGAHSDIYSLGATLYEMLTGSPPFRSDSVARLLVAIMLRDPEPPSRLRPEIDSELEAICLKCLQKNPVRRYASAAELGEDVGRYLRGEPTEAGMSSSSGWREQLLEAPSESDATALCRVEAESGNPEAMTLLVHRLIDGIGCGRDCEAAARWAQKAAGMDYAPAMTGLGFLYELGLGVDKNEVQALDWYRQAVRAGDWLAIDRVKALRQRMLGESVDEGETDSFGVVFENKRGRTPRGFDPHLRKAVESQGEFRVLCSTLPSPLALSPGERVGIGRQENAKIPLSSELVSRNHAELYWTEGALTVRDCGSTNGTMLNGYALRFPCPIQPGDVVTVGEVELVLSSVPSDGSDLEAGTSTRVFRRESLEDEDPSS